MWIVYDASGPVTIKYGSGTFRYVLNQQGDVVALLDSSGEEVVKYTYDAWGNVLSITGQYGNSLGIHNPLRYRGYVYDEETKLYYCNSRYYDPEIGRFINADVYTSTGQGLLGNNMFVYGLNNPEIYVDYTGTDAVVLYDKNSIGHIGIMVQDSNNNWWHYYWGTREGSIRRILCPIFPVEPYTWCKLFSGDASSLSEINASGQYDGDYEDMHYFEGNFSGVIECMQKDTRKYHLFFNNCSQSSLRILASADTNYRPLFNRAAQFTVPSHANSFISHNKNSYGQIGMRNYAAATQRYDMVC